MACPFCHQAAPRLEPGRQGLFIQLPIQVGKYLVSPLTRPNGSGRFEASVSIRSGSGRATHDRVLRLKNVFDSREAAAHHATAQGLAYIGASQLSAAHVSQPEE